MTAATAAGLLQAAFHEVAITPTSMSKLARAAVTRPNIEMEWVYELDGTKALQGSPGTRREVNFSGRRRADLLLDDTLVEFKSTRAAYAEDRAFDPAHATSWYSVFKWLSPDMIRMAPESGVFVLLMCTPDVPSAGEFKDHSLSELRSEGLRRYGDWLEQYGRELRPSARVEHCDAGQGQCGDLAVAHDALIVHWA
jgi:hypothetical protein